MVDMGQLQKWLKSWEDISVQNKITQAWRGKGYFTQRIANDLLDTT